MKYLGKNFIHDGIAYGKFLTSIEDDAAADILKVNGYVEFPKEAPSKAHRWLYSPALPDGGKWEVRLVVLRHYLKPNGTFSHSAELAPDDVPEGMTESPTAPPGNDGELYSTSDGGVSWTLVLSVYKSRKDVTVKAEALKRSRESFGPAKFQTVYQGAAARIAAATDQVGVDAAAAKIVWPV